MIQLEITADAITRNPSENPADAYFALRRRLDRLWGTLDWSVEEDRGGFAVQAVVLWDPGLHPIAQGALWLETQINAIGCVVTQISAKPLALASASEAGSTVHATVSERKEPR